MTDNNQDNSNTERPTSVTDKGVTYSKLVEVVKARAFQGYLPANITPLGRQRQEEILHDNGKGSTLTHSFYELVFDIEFWTAAKTVGADRSVYKVFIVTKEERSQLEASEQMQGFDYEMGEVVAQRTREERKFFFKKKVTEDVLLCIYSKPWAYAE